MEPAARARGHPRWLIIADEEQLPADKGPPGAGFTPPFRSTRPEVGDRTKSRRRGSSR
jgi:hypothetical protein